MRRRYIYIAIGIFLVAATAAVAGRVFGASEDVQTILLLLGTSAVILIGTRGYAELVEPLQHRPEQQRR